jgi:IS605 OrfB family transposase
MGKQRTRKKTKKKQSQGLVKTDVWSLVVTSTQKRQLLLTVGEYRQYLKPLVLIINAQWVNLASLTAKDQVNVVEKMIHATTANPNPKHKYYQKTVNKYPSFRKFPSYLRRAAIADAIGIVSSFNTRYYQWQSGERKRRGARPPRLSAMCNTYPALYKGQQIMYGSNYSTVDLKVWNSSDWVWMNSIRVKSHGGSRHLIVNNKMQSPALVVNNDKCQLSMPIVIGKVERQDCDHVASVHLGINNAAICSIVRRNGTVKARKFINPARDIDRRNRRRMMIAKKSEQTSNLTKEKLPKGFCQGLYRKSSNINLEISRKVASEIVKFAIQHNVKVIVLENLSGWKAKAGKRGALFKQKFHLWCHRKIVEIIKERWAELGGTVQEVNPKYTSTYAFDGSGKVKRSKHNYSLAQFTTGKQYNAGLSAAYNIGARYWHCVLTGDKTFSSVFDSKSSDDTLRTPVTLGTLRECNTRSSLA